jgi:isopentenyl diphosphate isomerase/L-lactate dehydrogenase-like FMN-dependent dehydrogenase
MVQRRLGTDRRTSDRRLNGLRSVEDVEAVARRRLPPSLYRSVAHGATSGHTKERNALSFDEVQFLPRAATYHQHRDVSTTVLGQKIELPVLAAPTGALA